MGSIPPELSLDVRQILISKTIGKFLADVSTAGGLPERIMKLDDLLARLDEELRKIEAFKRELPLCVCLLNDAIGAVNEELMECKKSIVEPKLSEFIPLKNSREEDDKEEIIMKENEITDNKKNWLSSAQLWNNYDSPIKDEKKSEQGDRPVNVDVGGGDDRYRSCKNMDGAGSFLSFKDFSVFPARTKRREEKQEFPVSGLPFVAPAIKNLKEDLGSGSTPNIHSNLQTMPLTQQQQQQSGRKQRRCWSPELHRRFVNALQQLGGSQAATPKQIRELMQVDGLTNDEVKSHLQKYRLHTRRLPTTNSSSKNQILGGLWMGKEGYSVSESSKQSDSGSPQGPLQLNGNSSRGDSICGDDDDDDEEKEEEEEEEEDDELDRHSWRNRTRKPVKHV